MMISASSEENDFHFLNKVRSQLRPHHPDDPPATKIASTGKDGVFHYVSNPTHKAKQIDTDQARYLFLKGVADYVNFWEKESRVTDTRGKLEGLAFSLLSMLDGSNVGLPGYCLVPITTEDDVEYSQKEGYDYYQIPPDEIGSYDIGEGSLHETIHQYFRGEVPRPEGLFDFGAHLAESAKSFWDKDDPKNG